MARQLKKWIFRYKGDTNNAQGSDLLSILKNNSVQILDNNLPKMLLVAGTDEEIESLKKEIDSGWIVAQENSSYPIPDTKKKISSGTKQK